MRALRLVADQKDAPGAARAILANMLDNLDALAISEGVVVAGYWPIVTELDVRPLMARLDERGVVCALPVLLAADAPLAFRRWRPIDPLEPGPLGTSHPTADAPVVDPDVVLVPLLAFDAEGYRLGQGGGYYDRTLAELAARRSIVTVGVGFAVQRMDRVPRLEHDRRLDWVVTEDGLVRTGPMS